MEALETIDDESIDLGGRPTLYRQEFNRQARRFALLGATDADIAEFFQVNESTLLTWKHKYPKFRRALESGKMKADAQVAARLHKRATGYSARETKAFVVDGSIDTIEVSKHIPADVGAAKLWLTNRRPDLWRDRSNVDVTSNGQTISQLSAAAWARAQILRAEQIAIVPSPALPDSTE